MYLHLRLFKMLFDKGGGGRCKSDTIIYLQSFDFTIHVLPIYFYDKKFQYETNKNMGLPSNQIKRAT